MTSSPDSSSSRPEPSSSEQLEQSVARWGKRPWEAPEVPPLPLLRAWAKEELVHEDLDLQIRESINCERTLALLDFLDEPTASDSLEGSPSLPSLAPEFASLSPSPEIGQFWTTRRAVESFRDGCLITQWTFDEVPVLLVAGPEDRGGGERVWSALAVTPAGNWPPHLRTEEDTEVELKEGGTFVAHLDLEYKVSESQLFRSFGEATDDQLEQLHSLGAGRPEGDPLSFEESGSEGLDEEAQLERERLLARCAFLPMTAVARRELRDWWESTTKWLETPAAEPLYESATQLLPAAAASSLSSTNLAVVCRSIGDNSEDWLTVEAESEGKVAPLPRLLLRDSKSADDKEPIAQWDASPLELTARRTFLLIDPRERSLLGRGSVEDGIASLYGESFDALSTSRNSLGDWVLIVIEPG